MLDLPRDPSHLRISVFVRLTSDPGGRRTHDLRIKSPLLYQLSYRVEILQTSQDETTWTTLLLLVRAAQPPDCTRFVLDSIEITPGEPTGAP